MSHWRGDGERLLGEAIRETNLNRKVELLIDANLLMHRELEHVMQNLGPENFSVRGLEEMRKEK